MSLLVKPPLLHKTPKNNGFLVGRRARANRISLFKGDVTLMRY